MRYMLSRAVDFTTKLCCTSVYFVFSSTKTCELNFNQVGCTVFTWLNTMAFTIYLIVHLH